MTYPRIYKLLKQAGHSPVKAAEITLDAARGDEYALTWVRILFHNRRDVDACTGRQ